VVDFLRVKMDKTIAADAKATESELVAHKGIAIQGITSIG
jgi:hypothetical protein